MGWKSSGSGKITLENPKECGFAPTAALRRWQPMYDTNPKEKIGHGSVLKQEEYILEIEHCMPKCPDTRIMQGTRVIDSSPISGDHLENFQNSG